MATLVSGGIGSGLDVGGLVSRLIQAERAPTEARLAVQEAGLQAKLSGFGLMRGALDKLKSALDGLNSTTLLSATRASSTDDTRLVASADATASTGSYAIEVSALAKAQSSHRVPLPVPIQWSAPAR